MSIETYSARRHYLNSLTAKLGGHTPAEWAKLLRGSARPRAPGPVARPAASAKPATAAERRLRLTRAEACMSPAPRPRAPLLLSPEACTSLTVGGGVFDRAPVIHAADGGAPPTSAAAKRMNVLATPDQMRAMRKRLERAAMG